MTKLNKNLIIMEKSKYLEPHFSKFITPIVKYCMKAFNLMPSDLASSRLNDGANLSHIMDIVQEEDVESLNNSPRKFDKKSRSGSRKSHSRNNSHRRTYSKSALKDNDKVPPKIR